MFSVKLAVVGCKVQPTTIVGTELEDRSVIAAVYAKSLLHQVS
jgi:hypothetical protein